MSSIPCLKTETEQTLCQHYFPHGLTGSIAVYHDVALKAAYFQSLKQKSSIHTLLSVAAVVALTICSIAAFAFAVYAIKNTPPRLSAPGEAEGALFAPFMLCSYGLYKAGSYLYDLITADEQFSLVIHRKIPQSLSSDLRHLGRKLGRTYNRTIRKYNRAENDQTRSHFWMQGHAIRQARKDLSRLAYIINKPKLYSDRRVRDVDSVGESDVR